jgi:hypothetical protein
LVSCQILQIDQENKWNYLIFQNAAEVQQCLSFFLPYRRYYTKDDIGAIPYQDLAGKSTVQARCSIWGNLGKAKT